VEQNELPGANKGMVFLLVPARVHIIPELKTPLYIAHKKHNKKNFVFGCDKEEGKRKKKWVWWGGGGGGGGT